MVFGKYELGELIASGGMAEVHLAIERLAYGARRQVVLKRILPSYANDPDFVEFFLHEGRIAVQLNHPNTVQAYELGQVGDVLYLSMEYVRGQTALAMARRAAELERHLSLDAIVKIAADIAAGLAHVHSACDVDGKPLKIIHRDVSPHNVMVAHAGVAKLVDFGIARTSCQQFRTRTGVVKGKVSYLAPEQITCGRVFDHRADLFALGVVMYELLTQRPLFRAPSEPSTLKRVLEGRIAPIRDFRPDCPPALVAVVMKALERDPDRRYANAEALLSALDQAAQASGLFPSITRLRQEMDALFGPGSAQRRPIPDRLSSSAPSPPDFTLERFLHLAKEPGRARTVPSGIDIPIEDSSFTPVHEDELSIVAIEPISRAGPPGSPPDTAPSPPAPEHNRFLHLWAGLTVAVAFALGLAGAWLW